jgi:HEPN domain-containing protein
MKDQTDLARGWLSKAKSDLGTISLLLEGPGPYDTACFHAQQAIEKALKALLAFHTHPIPRTHDLEEIQRLCMEVEPPPDLGGLDLTHMTNYAVAMRYDIEFWPDKPTAEDAYKVAQEVWRVILAALPTSCYP